MAIVGGIAHFHKLAHTLTAVNSALSDAVIQAAPTTKATCENHNEWEPMDSDEARVTYTAVLTPGEDGFVCAQIAEVPEAIS